MADETKIDANAGAAPTTDASSAQPVSGDEHDRDVGISAMRAQWGETEFSARTARGKQALDRLSSDAVNALSHTRYRDGTLGLNDPSTFDWLTDPARSPDVAKAIDPERFDFQVEQRITAIEAAVRTRHDEGLEHELKQLYKIRQRANAH